MNHARVTVNLVLVVCKYLDVNIYQLFVQAFIWHYPESDQETPRGDYAQFTKNGTVPQYVYDYVELIIEGME